MDSQLLTAKILKLQDKDGCWNVLSETDKYYPEYNYYVPSYSSTLWTLILLADAQTDSNNELLHPPLKIITNHFYDPYHKIFTIGKSHFPIPCLNGNMIYLLSYFKYDPHNYIDNVVNFFTQYQRFDDGDFLSTKMYPYKGNRSCYSNHTCYWGVVKLLKGLSFIPRDQRSKNAKILMQRCIDFILLHEVCFSSHNKEEYLHSYMEKLTFPNLYRSDFLEVLWLLKREEVCCEPIQ
ncbi:MAG: hypothetical protein EOM67_14825, partial [Spirochaetia bacterium]|nr:hypothetical protein [Spirochaetia bacterium]